MVTQNERSTPRPWRRTAVIAAVLLLVLGGSVVGYAAVNGWNLFTLGFSVSNDGNVLDDDGNVIGLSVDNPDGSSVTTVNFGEGSVVFETPQSLRGAGNIRVQVVTDPEAQPASEDK